MSMNTLQKIPREIELLEKACTFLAECQDLDEVKKLRDKAEALRLYSKQQGDSQKAQNIAAAVKIRAERRMGELLKEMPRQEAGRPGKNGSTLEPLPKLSDVGIPKTMSHRCQTIASVPEKEFQSTIDSALAKNKELTSKDVYKKGLAHQRTGKRLDEMDARAKVAESLPPSDAWEIIEGDCLKVLPTLKGKARLAFADPPYNIGVEYGPHVDDRRPADEFQRWSAEWIKSVYHALTDDGSLWLLINHEWAWVLCYEAVDNIGFHLQQWLIWYESFGANMRHKFNRTSRSLLWLTKDKSRHVFNDFADEIRRPSDREAKYNDARAGTDGKVWDDVWGINPSIPRVTGTSLERIPGFPTQLPLALVRPIIACASCPGDLVIDPFNGSGTTGAACIEMGRRYIGIELSREFAELSRKRLLPIPSSKGKS